MSRSALAGLFITTAFVAACGSSTRLVETWRDPAEVPFALNRTLAVFMTTDAGARRIVEDQLAARLPGGVASYRVIPDDSSLNGESVRQAVTAGQFDGAVTLRVVSVTPEVSSLQNTDFYGYWGYWRSAYDPLAYTASTVYSVQSTLHSFRDGKLVWTGNIDTIDPKNTKKLASRSAKATVKGLKNNGYMR
jgi:hypothetical protein